jgi:CHAT domain-containing protein
VQKEPEDQEVILSYIWNDFDKERELIIGLIFSKEQAHTFEIENTRDIREQLAHYQKLISNPFKTKEEQASFQKVSYQLFSNLLPNEKLRAMIWNKSLTIIPDGDLQNIPFESLITRKNSNEYLVLNTDIHYAYSYPFLKHNEQVDRETKATFIGYSPHSFDSLSLPVEPYQTRA